MKEFLDDYLKRAFEVEASDVHITVGKAPVFRMKGKLTEQEADILTAEDTERIVFSMLTEELWARLQEWREVDFSYAIEGISRFRVNAFYQQGELAAAIRLIPTEIPTLRSLHLPGVAKELTLEPQGLVLVTGPTGSGKSTTLASMINYMNENMEKNIVTLEDPIEYQHVHKQSVVNQREVGFDTKSFANGLRASLRQDPDVILVGEMRDLETISTAITATETGHLVFATLHTSDAISTIERIIDVFPSEQQGQIRVQLAANLKAVISQRLLPTADGTGRRVATEVLTNSPAVKNLVRNHKLHQVRSVMQSSRDQGMHTLDMDLRRLIHENIISYETAEPYLDERVID